MTWKSNKELKQDSLNMLKNNWMQAIFVCLIVWFMANSAEPLLQEV